MGVGGVGVWMVCVGVCGCVWGVWCVCVGGVWGVGTATQFAVGYTKKHITINDNPTQCTQWDTRLCILLY